MAKNDNLVHYLIDIANAIREKNGTSDLINAQDFADEIKNGGGNSGSSGWTGHADAEGLRAIGWTDEDIAYYQENGVNWNAEDDEYHKVTDDNKALYGVLNADNVWEYADRVVYLPKIDYSGVSWGGFAEMRSLVAIPHLNTSNMTSAEEMFSQCQSLVCVPPMDTSKVINMSRMFDSCYSLVNVPPMDTSNVDSMSGMFDSCYSLESIPYMDTSKTRLMDNMFHNCRILVSIPTMDTSRVTNFNYMFTGCSALVSIEEMSMKSKNVADDMFIDCVSLTRANIKDINNINLYLWDAGHLSKVSLLYIINNAASTSQSSIQLNSYLYEKFSNDADVIAALEAHPNVMITD